MLRLAILAALLPACSVTLQSKPSRPALASDDCSTTHAWWLTDASVATVAGGAAVTAYLTTQDTEHSDVGMAIAGVGALASLVYAASAHNGFKWRRECSTTRGHEASGSVARLQD